MRRYDPNYKDGLSSQQVKQRYKDLSARTTITKDQEVDSSLVDEDNYTDYYIYSNNEYVSAESLEEFVITYNNPKAERKHPNGNRNEDSRYMLAQIYSTNFEIYRGEEHIARLLTFIESVENDDFRGANRSLGMQIYRENDLQRNTIDSNNDKDKKKAKHKKGSK